MSGAAPGTGRDDDSTPFAAYAGVGGAPNPSVEPPPGTPQRARGLAVTALALGVLALFLGLLPGVGFAVGAGAVVVGVVAMRRRQPAGLAISGIVLGALGAVGSAWVTVALLLAG